MLLYPTPPPKKKKSFFPMHILKIKIQLKAMWTQGLFM